MRGARPDSPPQRALATRRAIVNKSWFDRALGFLMGIFCTLTTLQMKSIEEFGKKTGMDLDGFVSYSEQRFPDTPSLHQDNQTDGGGGGAVDDLTKIQHRYYIYNTSGLLIPAAKDFLLGSHEIWAIYETLQNHPLRTLNPDEATFFIPPIFVNAINPHYRAKSRARRDFMSALDLVTSSNIYQTTMGSRHIFVSIDGLHFSYKGVGGGLQQDIMEYTPEWMKDNLTDDLKDRWFPSDAPCPYDRWNHINKGEKGSCCPSRNLLKNAILAKDRDMWEIRRRVKHDKDSYSPDWSTPFALDEPIPNYGFSLGMIGGVASLPLIEPSYDDFMSKKFIYFYHGRTDAYFCNSTQYRLAPIEHPPLNDTAEAKTYLQSSVGYDLDAKTWKEHFMSSKFCLIVRGDIPHSKALLRSLKVGCIPVVASDAYPWYAPSLPSTLNFTDYTIVIDEQAFLRNPWRELHSVYSELTEAGVQQKLKAVAYAQRVMFTDHRDSLFVQAFLKEAWGSIPLSDRIAGCQDWKIKEKVPCTK